MRDGIALSRVGHPVIVFVHDNFARAARAQAEGLRMPGLKIYVYPQYKPGDSVSVEVDKAVKAAREFPALLEQRG